MTKLSAPVVNREQKDHLFRMIFTNKEKLLELYNALTGKNYTDSSLLEINTLENAIYLSMRNDLSFLIDLHMYLFGHQSSWNPNSPYRFFLYAADIYSAYTKDSNIYSSSLIRLPAPHFYIFYNGLDRKIGDRMELRLYDAFKMKEKQPNIAKEEKDCASDSAVTGLSASAPASETDTEEPWLELKVVVLNINRGHNKKLMEACKPLRDYAEYVSRVRSYAKEMDIQDAVEHAVDECIREGILSDFLSQNRSEAIKVSIYEYDEERHIQMERKEHYKKGFEDGEAKGHFETMVGLINDGTLTLDQAASKMSLSSEEFQKQCEKLDIRF